MVGSVVALFTAEGGLLDEGSIAELFGNWTYASSLTPWKYATRRQRRGRRAGGRAAIM